MKEKSQVNFFIQMLNETLFFFLTSHSSHSTQNNINIILSMGRCFFRVVKQMMKLIFGDETIVASFFYLALDQIHDRTKLKLKTEIERNENSIELLTLIFLLFFLLLERVLTTRRYVCQELGMETELRKFFHMKNEWNMRSFRYQDLRNSKLSECTGKVSGCKLFPFFIYICHPWSHDTRDTSLEGWVSLINLPEI